MNEDVHQHAALDTEALAWTTLGAGVEQRLLERAGVRESRLVRLHRGVTLPLGELSGGHDLYVLEGTLRDAQGRYPAGSYIGLPPSDRPLLSAPWGATVFAKVRPTARHLRVVVQTKSGRFYASHTPGFWVMPLDEQEDGRVVLLRFDARTSLALHHHDGGEEFFVLDGAIRDEAGEYNKSFWVRQPPASGHSVASERGCTLFTVAGHLA